MKEYLFKMKMQAILEGPNSDAFNIADHEMAEEAEAQATTQKMHEMNLNFKEAFGEHQKKY